jgi:mono/diheme cytochrome c family protein
MKNYLILLLSCGSIAFAQQQPGKKIFETKCAECHGSSGTKGRFHAANLQLSRLADAELQKIVSKGKKWMPSWEKRLKPEEISAVVNYIQTLRK